jgi:2-polyprenyl-6-methoxyphenol hydroxylase-like FAD-dependent oxidoreductase
MTIHARSMEMFDNMGMTHRLEEVCLECPGNIYHFPGMSEEKWPRTDYRALPSRYPFYYKISQNDFEQVLREHLYSLYSGKPEYQTELIALEQDDDGANVQIKHSDGKVEEARYRYVVGCDGVHSTIRSAAGISFEGQTVAVMGMVGLHTSVNLGCVAWTTPY